jgi:hypothetical protein
MQLLVAAVLVLTMAQEAPSKAALSRQSDGARTLIVTYSDGHTHTRLLSPRLESWSPVFPRQKNPPTHDGLPLGALKIDHVSEGEVAVVTVSLMYGSPRQRIVHVRTVRMTGTEPVQVDELSAFGVDPITLSLGVLPPGAFVQPSVSSASALLDARVDLAVDDQPVYKITFRNQSTRAVRAVAYRMYRDGKAIGSGRRKTNRSTPIIEPAGHYEFTFQAVGSTALGFDRFEVTGVLWDDGSVEGDAALKVSEQALSLGYAQQLRRVLAILRNGSAADGSPPQITSLAQIRLAVDALPIEPDPTDAKVLAAAPGSSVPIAQSIKIGQQQVKDAVLQDLADHLRTQGGSAPLPVQPWVEGALVKYSEWLDRASAALRLAEPR